MRCILQSLETDYPAMWVCVKFVVSYPDVASPMNRDYAQCCMSCIGCRAGFWGVEIGFDWVCFFDPGGVGCWCNSWWYKRFGRFLGFGDWVCFARKGSCLVVRWVRCLGVLVILLLIADGRWFRRRRADDGLTGVWFSY